MFNFVLARDYFQKLAFFGRKFGVKYILINTLMVRCLSERFVFDRVIDGVTRSYGEYLQFQLATCQRHGVINDYPPREDIQV